MIQRSFLLASLLICQGLVGAFMPSSTLSTTSVISNAERASKFVFFSTESPNEIPAEDAEVPRSIPPQQPPTPPARRLDPLMARYEHIWLVDLFPSAPI